MVRNITTLLLSLVLFVGCDFINPIGPIISIGVMWIKGEAHKYYNSDQDTIYQAVRAAAQELDFDVTEVDKNGKTISLKIDDKSTVSTEGVSTNRFNVRIIQVQHNVTKLSIRVNFWGDKPYAELFYSKVDKYPGVKSFTTVKELNDAVAGRR